MSVLSLLAFQQSEEMLVFWKAFLQGLPMLPCFLFALLVDFIADILLLVLIITPVLLLGVMYKLV